MSRRILATSGECAYEHTVPADAQKILLDFALFCTRETKALSDVVGDLVNKLNANVDYDYHGIVPPHTMVIFMLLNQSSCR